MDSLKQNPLAAAVSAEVSPLPVSPEEQKHRDAIVAELERLIEVARRGDFAAMIVTEVEPGTFPAKLKTGLWGESETIAESAAEVVGLYIERDRAVVAGKSDIFVPEQQPVQVANVIPSKLG
jgi:hypothetical protein